MVPHLARAAEQMPRSGIRRLMDAAWSHDGDVIGLHVGEPSFTTPPHVIEAGRAALARGETRYTPNPGIPALRQALAEKVLTYNEITATGENIVVSAGGMQAIFLSLIATIDPGDEVLIPDPGWPNFEMAVLLARGVPVRYALDPTDSFLPTVEAMQDALTDRTKVVIINSPSNPLGTVLTAERAERIVEFAADRGLWLLSDECYDALTFGVPHVSPARLGSENVLSCFSFSKTYAMTGLRVGYVVAPRAVSAQLAKLQEALIACVNAPAQYSALAALTGPQDQVTQMRDTYQSRRDQVAQLLGDAGVPHLLPDGAFYLWVDVRGGLAEPVLDWTLRLLADTGVAVAPGSTFGPSGEGWVRLSLATETEALMTGVGRLIEFVRSPR